MNCMTHTEIPATAYCRICGKALCDACQRSAQGTVYCAEHLPVGVLVQSQPAAGPPPPPPPPPKAPPPPPATHLIYSSYV